MPKITVPEKLLPFLNKPKRFKVAYGGRGGCKTMTFTDMLLMKAQTERAKIGCFREMQNSIDDSVHSSLKDEIERLELQGFTVQKADIEHQDGGIFKFKGLARNPDAIKSMTLPSQILDIFFTFPPIISKPLTGRPKLVNPSLK